MAFFLAIANRKGGVGKSTVAVMTAHALSVWGGKRVLLIDLDQQCNASLILMGGQGWDKARRANKTIADYFFDLFDEVPGAPHEYVVHQVGDVALADGGAPPISVLPGSLLLEDVQGELYTKEARESSDPEVVGNRVKGKLKRLLKRFESDFDVVIFDCAPGLSFAALAALSVADKTLVPFRPDYVSVFAVDRIAMLIQDARNYDDLVDIPIEKRRYACLANYVRSSGRERNLIDEIGLVHPLLNTQLPQRDGIANAFDWSADRKDIETKYGDATSDLRDLHSELEALVKFGFPID